MRKKALIVGIDKYHYNPLSGCVNDATELEKVLKTNEDGTVNFEIKLEKNVPTKVKLKKMISDLFSGDTSVALLYFSGHGIFDKYGWGFLVTPDQKEYDEGVSMEEILKMANDSKSQNKIIILDCCYSGKMGNSNSSSGSLTQIGGGVTILTACRENETAKEVNGHGIFTNLLLEALKGGAADVRGHITPGSIYSFIDQALGEWWQRPVFKTNITRFVSLRETKPQIKLSALRNIYKHFAKPTDDYKLNPSYEFTNKINSKHFHIEPYAIQRNVKIFQELQALHSIGLVVPKGAKFMYDAAMEGKACRLTPLGQHYWNLAKKNRF